MANASIYGRVVSYDTVTGSLVVTPLEYTGAAGSYSTWTVALAGQNGTSGASSSSGNSSSSGTSATAGTSGTSGSSGSSGASGSSSTSGTSASSASSGTTGTSGSAGAYALSGSSGSSGTSATSGTAASSGLSGTSGSSGLSGLSASSGSSGLSRSSGAAGPNGAPGSPGPAGPAGPTGATGPGTPYNQALFTTSDVYFYNLLSGCAGIVYANAYRIPDGGRFVNSGDQGTPWYGGGSNWYTYGALGASSFFTTSTREVKTNIEEFSKSALDLINSIDIVSFRYEHADEYLKVGIIADDSPEEITTKAHDQMIIPSTIGLAMKAIQELDKKLLTLQ